MVGMNSFGTNGRAGNMLFQWAFISSLSRKLNVPYVLPKWDQAHLFKGQIPVGQVKGRVIKERGYGFHDYTDLNPLEDLDFHGHFQNERYFDEKVKEDIQFTEEYKNFVKEKFAKLFSRPTISIGVRRTDYLKLPYYQLSATYYISALYKHFPQWRDYNLVFISDDLDWCRGHFGCLVGNAFFPNTKDMEQMCLSSLCDHFIIANSTFHWWGAYIGEKSYSKIIQPTKLFIGSLLDQHGDLNFYSDRWIKHEETPIDLKDVTFTIPVMHDHTDRRQNLELTVCLLQKNFYTNILIGEQGTNSMEVAGCEYIKFDYPEFHRTKMLNEMAKASTTPYVANWDCDVFTPPMQIIEAVHRLRLGQKMVYPYDDKFCRIMRKYRGLIFPWYDIGSFFDGDYGRDTPSFGGAVLWNKQAFFEIGGENENFISFGPEDIERMERAEKLGVKVERVKGRLYHFNHWCGPDSSVANPHFKRNRVLLDEQRKMTESQLREHISSWPWYSPYSDVYYDEISEEAITSAKIVLDILGITDQRVIDVGCGVGQWNNGNPNYYGVDYRIPKDKLVIPEERYIECDLEKDVVEGRYDYALCLEVAEHISEGRADALVKMLCSLADTVVFSAAIPYQGGNGHINEQWQSYWEYKFRMNGFNGQTWIRKQLRYNKDVEMWYRQNTVVYSSGFEYEGVDDYVLPEYYEQIVKHLKG